MTDNDNANTIGDLFRSLGGVLNNAVYFLLGIMYQIFFNVASAQLFETETIKNFYGRVQLIIGVFMVFKLTVSILQGIMDPDQFSNPKEGFGNFITRVVVALALLTVLVPINVPDVENASSYEKYLNNNGLLFGTLYSLQDRILTENTLGRLILGTTDTNTDTGLDTSGMTEAEATTAKLERSSRIFASTILKGFLRINLKPAEIRENDYETDKNNWYCEVDSGSENAALIETYQQLDVDPSSLLSGEVLKADCKINENVLDVLGNGVSSIPVVGPLFNVFVGNSRYLFAFSWVPAFFIGIIFLVILIGFTIDIAIRSIKLSVLRLLAPIPIISYIDPKSSKDGGMFSSWVKALTSTYLDLFLRLAIVYFVIFLIQDMIVNGIIINEATGMVGIMSFIFIMLGLFAFAKMAPKFIKDALGVKGSSMSNVGLSGLLGGAASVASMRKYAESPKQVLQAAGLGMLQGVDSSLQGIKQGKEFSPFDSWNQNQDFMAKLLTGDKDARGGFLGRTMDRLNYGVREGNANLLGIGKQDFADAEYMMKFRQQQAKDAQRELDFATQAYQNATGSEREAAYKRYQDAYEKYDQYNVAAQKAKSTYDNMNQDRKILGVQPNAGDNWSTKYRAKGTYRSPLGTSNDPYGTASKLSKEHGLPEKPINNDQVLGTIQGHSSAVNNFSGTRDDSTPGSFGHGSDPRGH